MSVVVHCDNLDKTYKRNKNSVIKEANKVCKIISGKNIHAQVVQRLDSAIHRINHYPANKY